jgi:hypothetical protein
VDDSPNVSRLKPMLSKGGRQYNPVVFVNHPDTLPERMDCDQHGVPYQSIARDLPMESPSQRGPHTKAQRTQSGEKSVCASTGRASCKSFSSPPFCPPCFAPFAPLRLCARHLLPLRLL